MPRSFNKVILKPDVHSADIFQVVVNPSEYTKWKEDRSIPIADVVDSFQVFHTNQGTQGILGHASKQQLENHFGTSKDIDVVLQILEKGEMQTATAGERYGSTNDSIGGPNVVSAGSYSNGGHGGR